MMNTDYWIWKRYAKPALIVCFVLLVAVLIPGIGVVRGGARSWLGIGSFGIQPSEFMKMGMIIYLSKWLSEQKNPITAFTKGLLPPLALVGLAFGIIMLQPDLGTGAVLVGATLLIIYTAGARLQHLSYLGLIGVAGFVGLVIAAPYRLKRITAFLDPWQDPLGAGYQAIQSLYAIGPGGLVGLGLGMSRQKNTAICPSRKRTSSFLSSRRSSALSAVPACSFCLWCWSGAACARPLRLPIRSAACSPPASSA